MTHAPILVYPLLSAKDNWQSSDKDGKPGENFRVDYLRKLELVINELNTAGVAHMDLRPTNILWRPAPQGGDGEVEMKVIDFEDALFFDELVLNRRMYDSNPNYPLYGIDQAILDADMKIENCQLLVTSYYNDWFFDAITAFVMEDEAAEFSLFMKTYSKGLLESRILHDLVCEVYE